MGGWYRRSTGSHTPRERPSRVVAQLAFRGYGCRILQRAQKSWGVTNEVERRAGLHAQLPEKSIKSAASVTFVVSSEGMRFFSDQRRAR
jgi:hypothetical protein